MIKVLLGPKGTGKTKTMLELSDQAVKHENGAVVFIERGNKLIHEVNRDIRLVDTKDYHIESFNKLYGFLCGMAAGNYDINQIFIDSIFKITKDDSMSGFETFLDEIEELGKSAEIDFVISVSADTGDASDKVKSYY